MSTFWQRILTVAAGAGIVVAGALTGTAAVLVPLGLSVAAWAVPHPADAKAAAPPPDIAPAIEAVCPACKSLLDKLRAAK
jgi:hypothetical protein